MSVSINRFVLEHCHPCVFAYCLWLPRIATVVEQSLCAGRLWLFTAAWDTSSDGYAILTQLHFKCHMYQRTVLFQSLKKKSYQCRLLCQNTKSEFQMLCSRG